jgi:hypothetical protein
MHPNRQPMVLGILTALAFLFVAAITYPVNRGVPPPDGERIVHRR